MRQRGEADFAPSSVGRATRRETRLTSRESPPSERRLQLICDAARRASGSLRDRRPLLQQRGPATPPPATTVVPRPRLPAHGTRAVPGRTSPQQAAMGGAAAAMAASSGPPCSYTTASERPARWGASLHCPSRPGSGSRMRADIGYRGRSRSAAGKSARRRLCGRAHAGEGGDDLVQRGLGRPGACPALGGAAGRPSALAERPNSRKSLRPSLRGGSRAPPGAQSGTRAYLRPRRCVKGHVTRFSDSGCTQGTHRRGR